MIIPREHSTHRRHIASRTDASRTDHYDEREKKETLTGHISFTLKPCSIKTESCSLLMSNDGLPRIPPPWTEALISSVTSRF